MVFQEDDTVKRIIPLVLIGLFAVLAGSAQSAATTAPLQMEGEWHMYRVNALAGYTLNDYRNARGLASYREAALTLADDGTVTTDAANLRFESWSISDKGFLVFTSQAGNAFYKVWDINENVYMAISVDVTERNDRVIEITTNPTGNMVLVRQ